MLPRAGCAAAVAALLCLYALLSRPAASSPVPVVDHFRGPKWRAEATVAARLVASTRFVRFEEHSVRTETGKVVDDWLWFDEIDAVNVVVRTAGGEYLLLRQRHYGLAGEHLALLGGVRDREGEPAVECARRELLEEIGYTASGWTDLGAYQTAANRGGGAVTCFLASGAAPAAADQRVADHDYEARAVVKLSPAAFRQRVLSGGLPEVKWTACAALALLHGDA
eukprot:TRINITY_DN30186_c0_g1_i1.p2 TRINITY_DN30186_c0_g1~~TRINITY_DN30186_c0_g1_i1.p2  ORF type:complete len:224 (+),score=76.17 TRINITY_DN30186_c0_g1_i1:54-725(+)